MQMNPPPTATFLFCIESGILESQTLLAIECLRQFGGSQAQAPVLAVTPRRGPSLTLFTYRRFDELGVRYIREDQRNSSEWFTYMNKGLAAKLGDELAKTEQVIWLDSDVLVVSSPEPLLLQPNEDFACGAINKNVGSTGPEDPFDAYWRALADAYQTSVDNLPWVVTQRDNQRVRLRLHSGVYSFRRGRGIGARFVNDLETMLGSRVAFSRKLPQPGDDVALAFSVAELKLRWRNLSQLCNYQMAPSSPSYSRDEARQAHILHYHHTLSSESGSDWFLNELRTFRPDVAAWLKPRLPLNRRAGGLLRLAERRLLRMVRSNHRRKHEAQCRFMVHE
ncbi:hypothetical protein [Bradyrhizobium sp. AS23.2]|uniref:hypothetical protein n=1 Tax=Bradyrhizobium sp. AS23.2 TaxID=1680155 RepID=UPI00093EDF91|nr:hypothetical protein [Bradyrhizobium sp. AS23.2]OKO73846.1 hypothetical protein AC630_27735 [Bradyrhizobium sp. AS23.2]